MPISNAYISESILPSEISKNGVVRSDSSHSLNSKSSENSEKLYSDSVLPSRLDFMHDNLNPFFPYKKERKSFWTQRSSIHKLEDFSNDPKAYYSDFYDSTEQLPAVKKCENFHQRNADYNWSSESDIFKRQAMRRFSLNPNVLRNVETSKCLPLSLSLDNMNSFGMFHDLSDWNDSFGKPSSSRKSVSSEESMSRSNFDNLSDSDSNNSSDCDYERSLKKSIRDYFKNRIDRDSTSSLCTSQSSSYAMSPFPEETVDPFEELDDTDEHHFLNSPTLSNDRLPLYSSLLNLRSTAAEQMLVNLGFCHSSQIIPARFFQNWPKQENGETLKSSSKKEIEAKSAENNQHENSKERHEDTISKNSKRRHEDSVSKNSKRRHEESISKNSKEKYEENVSKNSIESHEDIVSKNSKERQEDSISESKKGTEVDSNVEHLLMNKKNAICSSNKSSSIDFEEINQSTVHIINNNKHVFYKQKSILDEIEEANRNISSETFKMNEENSHTCNTEPYKNIQDQEALTAQNYNKQSFKNNINVEMGEKDQSLLQKNNDCQIDTKNAFCSRTPNTHISNETFVSNISEKSQESLEIESIFSDSKQESAELRTKIKEEKNTNEETHLKSVDNKFLNPCLFLSVSCTSSPAESPLTVIDVSALDNKDKISASCEKYIQKKINNSPLSIDSDSDDTLNNMADDQLDENSSNVHCIQEDFSNSKQFLYDSIKASDSSLSDKKYSGVEEWYLKDDENCCHNAYQQNPYLTFGPDVVTIYKNSSEVNNKDNNSTKLSSPGFYTSNFDMFIVSPQKKKVIPQYQSLDEREKFHSRTFSPLVINGIRFDGSEQNRDNFSERGFGDGEDTIESKVFHAASYFSSSSKTEKTAHYSEERDECCNLNDSPTENKEKNCSDHINKENKNHWPEIQVSKANIIFRLDSQNPWNNKISSKVTIKNINCSQRKWPRQRSSHTSDNKYMNDSWTQCNFEDCLNKRNFCDNDNFPTPNYSKKYLLKNSSQPAGDLYIESKDRKMLLNKKRMLTSATIKNNSSINVDFRNLKDDVDELDFSKDFNPISQLLKDPCTEKAVLSLHKSSQTRIGGLYPLCKNELNICAKCLNHTNWSCLQPLGK